MSGSDRLSDRGLAASWRVSGLIVIKWRGSSSVEVRPVSLDLRLIFPVECLGFLLASCPGSHCLMTSMTCYWRPLTWHRIKLKARTREGINGHSRRVVYTLEVMVKSLSSISPADTQGGRDTWRGREVKACLFSVDINTKGIFVSKDQKRG